MITEAMNNSGGSSMIRKITRGTSSGNGDVTISCSITDTSKVIVILDADLTYTSAVPSAGSVSYAYGAAGGSVYLKSISTTNIIVNAKGITTSSNKFTDGSITFSYQIIEFN